MPSADLQVWNANVDINPPGGLVGPILASTTTLVPTNPVHHVSGTNTITDITLPWTGFRGRIVLIPDGAFVLNTGGTAGVAISRALTATANQPIELIFDGTIWNPLAGR
jgi:hypothetical protein